MVLILTLQLLIILLLATTGFAGTTSGCPHPSLQKDSPAVENYQLSNVFMGFAQLSYNCTDSGSYDIVELGGELFDATCLNGPGFLEQVVNITLEHIQENPDIPSSDLGVFIEEKFDFTTAALLKSINTTSFEIDFMNGQLGNAKVVVTDSEDYEGKQMKKNEDESLLVLVDLIIPDSDAPSPSTCAAGYVGSVDAVVLAWFYEPESEA